MTINFDDFKKLDIKIGTILEITVVENSDNLLKILVDMGTEKRQIVSGIAKLYPNYNSLIGKQVPVLLNLEYKNFRGVESQGMILMADMDDKPLQLFPEKSVPNGTIVR